MQPLKEQGEPRYPLEADALSLLRAVERYEPPPGQKQRVTARLLARGSGGRARVMRAPMALAFLLCAAGASAAVSGPWLARSYRALVGASTDAKPSESEVAAKKARTSARAIPRVEPKPQVVADVAPEPEAGVGALQPPAQRVVEPASAREETQSAARARSVASSEPASLVFGAMHALRREGRPDRAAKLLDEYRRRYPSGALAEEALALSVEAATLRGDPRAKALADAYLARYPGGQFQKAAERARALFSP
jgi:hypothetical protein